MFGKLNKLKQAAKFAQKASKGFPMNRRKFMQGMLAGIATVAIASKLAPKFPVFEDSTFPTGWIVTEDEIDEGLYGEISSHYADALAYSMRQTKEAAVLKVLG